MTERKAVIKNADMSEEMQQDAIDCATQVREKRRIVVRRSAKPLSLQLGKESKAVKRRKTSKKEAFPLPLYTLPLELLVPLFGVNWLLLGCYTTSEL